MSARTLALVAGATLACAAVARADEPAPATAPATTAQPTTTTPTTTTPTPTPTTTTPPTTTPTTTTPATTTTTPTATTTPATTDATPSSSRRDSDDDGVPRLSLPTEADRAAWRRSGFRLGLGAAYGELVGLRGAPGGRLLAAVLHIGLRLDADWSVYASFQYASASRTGELSGLRFAGTIDPTWHVTSHLSLAAGFGFGGIVEGRTGRMDVEPLPSTLDTSYTFPDARTPLPSCSGVGAAGLVRAEWSYVLGPRASTGLSVEAIGQETACVDPTGRLEPDTARPIVRRQYWPHAGVTVGWGITWR
ncbi:MAG TPA: hypothetical protein VHE35_07760 [Kofleriaceae bacterium]|nr:hypothetical protein [Kofleriaceae bacterium]